MLVTGCERLSHALNTFLHGPHAPQRHCFARPRQPVMLCYPELLGMLHQALIRQLFRLVGPERLSFPEGRLKIAQEFLMLDCVCGRSGRDQFEEIEQAGLEPGSGTVEASCAIRAIGVLCCDESTSKSQ